MRTRFIGLLLILITLALSSSAWADGYLWLGGCGVPETQCQYQQEMTLVSMPIYACGPDNPEFDGGGLRRVQFVTGFEVRLRLEPGLQLMGVTYPAAAINAGTGENYVVGFASPVAVSEPLATFHFLVGDFPDEDLVPLPLVKPCYLDDSATTGFFLTPVQFPSIPGSAAIVDAEDTDGDPLVSLELGSAFWDYHLTPDPAVATAAESWGHIKALYR